MDWRSAIPFLGWVELDAETVEACDLEPEWLWKGVVFEWFGAGLVIWAKAYDRP